MTCFTHIEIHFEIPSRADSPNSPQFRIDTQTSLTFIVFTARVIKTRRDHRSLFESFRAKKGGTMLSKDAAECADCNHYVATCCNICSLFIGNKLKKKEKDSAAPKKKKMWAWSLWAWSHNFQSLETTSIAAGFYLFFVFLFFYMGSIAKSNHF